MAAAAAPPARVASLNLCTDSLLFELLPDSRIASVTALSRDDNLSHFHARAARIAVNHGAVEEVVALRPDLVVTSETTDALATRMLSRLGLRVLSLPSANRVEDYRHNLRRLAEVLGEERRAESLLTGLDAALGAAPRPALRALVYQPNGYTPGDASLMHAMLAYAGLRNMALEVGLAHGGYLSLEALLLSRPDIVVFSQRQARRPSLAEAQLSQPALRKLFARDGARTVRADVPENLWTCAGAFNADAVALLRGARP
ncbi:MAG: ABC transporter substrate-binding protein [Proteobacteria bacterium]|nr:ABC transporter substrate-binding protein [Pseudomonadota bacterium]